MRMPARSTEQLVAGAANTILLSLLLSSSFAFPQEVTSIQIKSTYAGWGMAEEELIIEKKNSRYYSTDIVRDVKKTITGNVPKEMVSDAAVRALLDAINSKIIEKPDLENLGVTQTWLNENAKAALSEHLKNGKKILSSAQKEHLMISFTDLQVMKKVVNDYYSPYHRWTDDDPSIEIIVRTEGDKVINITSESQQEFMLPWHMSSVGPGAYFTWDATFSRVIAQMLPEGFVNRDRIAGRCFREVLFD